MAQTFHSNNSYDSPSRMLDLDRVVSDPHPRSSQTHKAASTHLQETFQITSPQSTASPASNNGDIHRECAGLTNRSVSWSIFVKMLLVVDERREPTLRTSIETGDSGAAYTRFTTRQEFRKYHHVAGQANWTFQMLNLL